MTEQFTIGSYEAALLLEVIIDWESEDFTREPKYRAEVRAIAERFAAWDMP